MKFIATLIFSLALFAGVAAASPYSNIYCYPTGTYWQKQFSNPNNTNYYATHNAQFLAKYGPGTKSCQ